jgi:methylated-DNA-[protein]-cysteine S-methyltransferase
MQTAIIQTKIGKITIEGNENGIASIYFCKSNIEISNYIQPELKEAVTQLNAYFDGTSNYINVPLNFNGTDFQKNVWLFLLQIPFGETITYLELAKKMGNPKAIRAIASAIGKNPILIAIPCHRVIGTNGELTGYSGGLSVKKWLLEHENPTKQQILF